MAERVTHKKPDAIWLFDYTSLQSMSDCDDRIVCLSERSMNIIWQAILNISRFRSRVFLEAHGSEYVIVTPDNFSDFQIWVSDLNVQLGDFMACNEILQSIADSIALLAAKDCCQSTAGGGSGGAGLESAPANDFELDPVTGDPPAGFASWEEYDEYACDMANYILDQIIGDIATTFVVGAGAASAGVLGTALLTALFTPIGWATIAAIAALFFTLLIAGINAATLTGLLEDNRDELVCSILDGDDVITKLASFGDAVDTAVAADATISALGSLAVGIAADFIKSYATTDSFNRMINKVPYPIPSATCDCGSGDPIWAINPAICTATIDSGDFSEGVETTVSSCEGIFFGTTRAGMAYGSNPDSEQERQVDFTGVTGGGNFYVTIVNDDNPAPGLSEAYTAAELAALSIAAYQIQITRLDASDTTAFTTSLIVTVI